MMDYGRNIGEDVLLFDPEILKEIKFSPQVSSRFNSNLTVDKPGEGLKVRPLSSLDYDRGFLQLLSQMTIVGDVTKETFLDRFYSMKYIRDTYYVLVIEDINKNKVIGAATLVIERKFIRGCSKRGLLEDVVVNDEYRGRQLGKLIVTIINLLAEKLGCYKIGLTCKDKMKSFYSSLDYVSEENNGNYMQIRF